MKTLIIFLTLLIFSITNSYSTDTADCKTIKKTSSKYLLCKVKGAGSSIKNKFSKKETKSKNGKKSFLKKFGEAKTLSDLN